MTSTVNQMKLTQRFLRHSLNPTLIGLLVHLSFASLAQAQDGIEPNLLYKVHGDPEGGDFGAAIAGLGDMDRDGIGDFAVTAYWTIHTETAGRQVSDRRTYVRVFSGRDGLELYTIRSEPFAGLQDRGGVHGSRYALGDLDGDQVPEFFFRMKDGATAAIISGKTGEVFRSHELEGAIGFSVNMGDLDQDGFKDYMIYDQAERPSGFFDRDETFRIHSGRTGEILVRMKWGKDEDDPLVGAGSCGVSDLNGDGVSEIAWHSYRRGSRVSEIWIISGALRGEHL